MWQGPLHGWLVFTGVTDEVLVGLVVGPVGVVVDVAFTLTGLLVAGAQTPPAIRDCGSMAR